ncbi:MAG: hypothetical protein AAGA03_13255 [Planctomycetota bacterium]
MKQAVGSCTGKGRETFGMLSRRIALIIPVIWFGVVSALIAAEPASMPDQAEWQASERGYRLLLDTPFLTSDFSQKVFDRTWETWPQPLRSQAAEADLQQRRRMAFQRYGLTTRPADSTGKPLQYVVDPEGNWTMNCFSCHGGSVYGTPTPGAPNNRFGLQTMTEEIRAAKFRMGELLTRMDLGSMFIPLGTTHGTTNAVVFGQAVMHTRDRDLNYIAKPPLRLTHHDMDAPPWWHFHKRPYLYIDGFAQKGHRGLMQFTLIPENDAQFYRDNEDEFQDIYAYLSSLRAPEYTGDVNRKLARQGRAVFNNTCAECHGTYGGLGSRDDWSYPNRRVPLSEIGTDPVRSTSLTAAGRRKYAESWFAHAGEADQQVTVIEPDGYVAPPLDGVWASPPYFHNGSVPTLWHVLHPEERPTVWRRSDEAIDSERVGFQIEVVEKVPVTHPDAAHRRTFFDTRVTGKSNQGHDYPAQLSESEKRALLEYLKTL